VYLLFIFSSIYRAKTKRYEFNLHECPVSSCRPTTVLWVEIFILAPMLSIACDRNQHYLVTAWTRAHLGKAAAAILLKEFFSLVEPEDALPCSQEQATVPYFRSLNAGHTLIPCSFKLRFNVFHVCIPKSSN
jgi:hypothetical protein